MQHFPDLLIMISPLMKQNYELFGAHQFAAMDTTFNLIKEKGENETDYKVGFIVGLSYSKRIVPYAMFVILN